MNKGKVERFKTLDCLSILPTITSTQRLCSVIINHSFIHRGQWEVKWSAETFLALSMPRGQEWLRTSIHSHRWSFCSLCRVFTCRWTLL
ncbi:uncharacterized protein J3R85_004792 [Psidium guajava]|nr:uncharacterized protein J3R85_004792 [Psidium guajava]